MAGQELDELGEYDNEFVQNISKFANSKSKLFHVLSLMQKHVVPLPFIFNLLQ